MKIDHLAFQLSVRIFATSLLLYVLWSHATDHPSYLDLLGGIAAGGCVYSIWILGKVTK